MLYFVIRYKSNCKRMYWPTHVDITFCPSILTLWTSQALLTTYGPFALLQRNFADFFWSSTLNICSRSSTNWWWHALCCNLALWTLLELRIQICYKPLWKSKGKNIHSSLKPDLEMNYVWNLLLLKVEYDLQ